MTERHEGRVKWFNNKLGYGFLTDLDSGNDLFVHHQNLATVDGVYKYLVEGEYVSYEEHTDNEKIHAVSVRGIREGKLMCETRQERSRKSNNDNDN